jgi:hypothetical protein
MWRRFHSTFLPRAVRSNAIINKPRECPFQYTRCFMCSSQDIKVWTMFSSLEVYADTRTIRKVTSGELLTKQAARTNFIIYKKYVHISKRITAEREAFVVSGNEFLYTCVKEVCRLWAQPCFDTFHQFVIIVEALWSQPVIQEGKQVVVAWSSDRVQAAVCGRVFLLRSIIPHVSMPCSLF